MTFGRPSDRARSGHAHGSGCPPSPGAPACRLGDKVYELEHRHLLRRSREAGLSLTVGEVALIAAGIEVVPTTGGPRPFGVLAQRLRAGNLVCMLAGMLAATRIVPKAVEAFRTGDGIGWHEHDPDPTRTTHGGSTADRVSGRLDVLAGIGATGKADMESTCQRHHRGRQPAAQKCAAVQHRSTATTPHPR